MIVYFNGEFVPRAAVSISPDDRGFLLGDGVYEVIRSYNGRLFALKAHLKRLEYSLQQTRIERPAGVDFGGVAEELIRVNGLQDADALVYLQVTRGVAPRKHAFPPDTPPTVYAFAAPFEPPREKWRSGVKVILVPDIRWLRCDVKSISLLPNVLANQQAKENDAYEAVFVRNGVVTEGSHTNFCAVFDGRLFTHPKSPYILPGITRDVVLDLCRNLNIPVEEYPILEKELPDADELIVTGTTTEIMPVVQVNGWTVGDGQPGPVTRKLQRAFDALTKHKAGLA